MTRLMTVLLVAALGFVSGCAHMASDSSHSTVQSALPECGPKLVRICDRVTTRQECECLPPALASGRTMRMGMGRGGL